jgi:hypothetical protein
MQNFNRKKISFFLLLLISLSLNAQNKQFFKEGYLKTNVLQVPNGAVHWNLIFEDKLKQNSQSNNFSIGYSIRNYDPDSQRKRLYFEYERRFYSKKIDPMFFVGTYAKVLYRDVKQRTNAKSIFDFFASGNKEFTSISLPLGFSIGFKSSDKRKISFELPVSAGLGFLLFNKNINGLEPEPVHIEGQMLFLVKLKL